MSTASIRTHRSNHPALLAWAEAHEPRERDLLAQVRPTDAKADRELRRNLDHYSSLVWEMVDRAETLEFTAAARAGDMAAVLEKDLFGSSDESAKVADALGLERDW